MKKILYILCAVFALASCTKEELPTTGGQNPDGTYTFNIGIEEPDYAPQSRAVVTMGRYVMEMYEGDLTATPIKESNSTGVFTVEMKKNVDYVCLFWADNGSEAYNATSLQAVKQADETKLGTAAYFAKATANSKTFNGTITLKRAVAELSFIDKNGLTEATNTLKITYPYAWATFNLADGTVAHATGSAVRTITNIAPPADKATAFTTDYLLAPTEAGKIAGLKFQLNAEEEKTIDQTAIKANVKTKITGEYFVPLPSMSFTIDLAAYSSDKSYILPFGTSTNRAYTLTVAWGDGQTETIAPTASVTEGIKHEYADAKTYQITITSSQKDPTKAQVPDFRPGGNKSTANNNAKKLKSMDTPMLCIGYPFTSAFYGCTGLSSIPADLFANNTLAINFSFCFNSCTGLSSIPADLFASNKKATNFSKCFDACSNLSGEIPADLFANNTEVTNFSDCFNGCRGLSGKIPAGLFASNTLATSFSNCFYNCSGLSEIPADLFASNKKATNFSYCFYGCTGLSGIPTDLFANNTSATSFSYCFNNCTGLSGIPADLFASNTLVTDFSDCFNRCSGLSGTIPAGLFTSNTEATNFSNCFYGCTGLSGIPADLFANNTEVTNFSYCFYGCTGLSSAIPAGLFANQTSVANFAYCFSGCSGLSGAIPADLFASNTLVTNFSNCFYGCIGLSAIPAGLFASNTSAISFERCFYNCNGLSGTIPADLFASNTLATNFSNCFSGCRMLVLNADIFCVESEETKATRFAGKTMNFSDCFYNVGASLSAGNGGIAPALWNYTMEASSTKTRCFNRVTKVTNVVDIPTAWK